MVLNADVFLLISTFCVDLKICYYIILILLYVY